MKRIVSRLIFSFMVFAFSASPLNAIIHSTTLRITGFQYTAPDKLIFSVYLKNNYIEPIAYGGGQYIFTFNNDLLNGSIASFSILSTGLPPQLVPKNPRASLGLLITVSGLEPGFVFGFNINPGDSVLIAQFQLKTYATAFSNVPQQIVWQKPPHTHPTQFALIVDSSLVDATSDCTFLNDISGVDVTVIPQAYYNVERNTLVMRDTFNVFLASRTAPYSLIDTCRVVIDSVTFTGHTVFHNAPDGMYYLVVKHRNCIQTWSATGINFHAGSTLSYDFTSSMYQAYGGNLIHIGTKWCTWSGDVNQDCVVDISDMVLIDIDSYNYATGYLRTDVNADGCVDISDMVIVDNNSYNFNSCITPGGK